jgi:hypothetical protein
MQQRLLLFLATCALAGTACNDGRSFSGTTDAATLSDTDADPIIIDVNGEIPDTGTDIPDDGDEVIVIPDVLTDQPPDIAPDIPLDCGDGVVDADEECDDGDANSDTDPDACRNNCIAPGCGDGVTDSEEECDDGADNSSEADACRLDCTAPFCGDGIVDGGEDCDGGPDCDDECFSPLATLCDPCEFDDDCGGAADFCVDGGCGVGCGDSGCPDDFVCADVLGGVQCVPESSTCQPCSDPDGDGYGIGPECLALDCNEADAGINPGAPELCDRVDNNCNGDVDESGATDDDRWYADRDGDRAGDPDDFIEACGPTEEYPFPDGDDCDADDGDVYPGAPDFCDGIDNDCEEETSDGADDEAVGTACDGPDDDRCAGGSTECLDGVLTCTEGAEGTRELCDGIDNDCDPSTRDGSGDERLGEACDGDDADSCEEGSSICVGGELVCDDTTDDQLEICNEEDDDCDGVADEDAGDLWYRDEDGDRYGSEDDARTACVRPPRYTARAGDCDDDDPDVNPGEDDVCDGRNNDCVGGVDDDPAYHESGWPDRDGDGFGEAGGESSACELPDDFVDNGEDCNDDTEEAAPGLDEICGDGLDNDCFGGADCADAVCADSSECVADCADESLGAATGLAVAEGSTVDAGADRFGSCAGGGPELVFQWFAPETGTYLLDTLGSDFDTVLYVLESCEGEEVVCNDDGFSGGDRVRSLVSFDARVGDSFLIVVDGFGPGSDGNYVLNITLDVDEICDNGDDDDEDGFTDCADVDCAGSDECAAVDCPAETLGGALGEVASGDTTGESFSFEHDCGGDGPDVAYNWTAPSTGGFDIEADADFDVDIAVFAGCEGEELTCGTGGRTLLDLTEGDTVTIVVDGEDPSEFGEFTLTISELEFGRCGDGDDNDDDDDVDCFDLDCAADAVCAFEGCAEADLGSELGVIARGDLTDFPFAYTAECGLSGSGLPAGGLNAPDAFYTWTAPFDGVFTFDTLGSDFDTLLAVLDGECGGDEIACNDDAFAGDVRTRSQVTVDLAEGELVTIAVSGWGESTGDFLLNAAAVEVECTDGDDNDHDGTTDCEDDDCVGTDACLEICDDGFDNDGDELVDCADDDCEDVCIEICDDGFDNDDDELIDCADDECAFDVACCPDDVFEPNEGTAESPSTVWDVYTESSSETLSIRIGDTDSFRVPICRGGTLSATAEFTHADGDLSLVLRNRFGFTLATSDSDTDDEVLRSEAVLGGDYFLQVNIADEQCQSYVLTMAITGCP